mmetsp:Transcript_11650/g.35891  ORF Transcript_11650/g.35891 Transcript_11650/m.35891 type:complete len:237 (+) Transcript_11650:483-1193(+)
MLCAQRLERRFLLLRADDVDEAICGTLLGGELHEHLSQRRRGSRVDERLPPRLGEDRVGGERVDEERRRVLGREIRGHRKRRGQRYADVLRAAPAFLDADEADRGAHAHASQRRGDGRADGDDGAGALVADRHWVAAFGRAPPLTVVARIHGRRRHFYEDVERTGRRHVARFDCDFRGHEIFGRFDTDEALHRRRRRCDRSHLWRVSGLVNPRGCNARVCARVLEAMRLNATRLKG